MRIGNRPSGPHAHTSLRASFPYPGHIWISFSELFRYRSLGTTCPIPTRTQTLKPAAVQVGSRNFRIIISAGPGVPLEYYDELEFQFDFLLILRLVTLSFGHTQMQFCFVWYDCETEMKTVQCVYERRAEFQYANKRFARNFRRPELRDGDSLAIRSKECAMTRRPCTHPVRLELLVSFAAAPGPHLYRLFTSNGPTGL